MAFENFPYADFHALNLDWILKKLKDTGKTLDELLKEVAVHSHILNGAEYETLVKEAVKEWIESGGLDPVLREELLKNNAYLTDETVSNVNENHESFVVSKARIVPEAVFSIVTKDGSRMCAISQQMVYQTDMPMSYNYSFVNASVDTNNSTSIDANLNGNGTRVRFRIVSFDPAIEEGQTLSDHFTVRILQAGPRRATHSAPEVGYNATIGAQIAALAHSYTDTANTTPWGYGRNFVTHRTSDVVKTDGKNMMECDTLVSMVMMGVPFNQSPYSTDATTYSFDNLVLNPDGYSWALPWATNEVLNRRVTWIGGQCWWFWDDNPGRIFTSRSEAKTGDVVYLRKSSSRWFDHVSHTGIIEVVNGKLWVHHVTGSGLVTNPMRFEPLDDVITRGGYTDKDTDVYFARVAY